MAQPANASTASESKPQPAPPWGKTVLVEFDEGIAWVTLNRPEKRNAVSPELSDEMIRTLDALEVDRRCGVLVLTGAGEAYCAGMDLREYFRATDSLSPEERARYMRASAQWQWRRLSYYMKPTICMVNGWCFGGAFNHLIGCDLAIADEDAQLGLSEINWGIIPAGNVLKSVASVMNQRDSLYYTMTGEPFSGRKAVEMGLVNEAHPKAKLRPRVRALAIDLLGKNPTVLRAAKHACRRVRSMDWDELEDYLFAKLDQSRFLDPEKGREKGMGQFLDEKTYRPGLTGYRRET